MSSRDVRIVCQL